MKLAMSNKDPIKPRKKTTRIKAESADARVSKTAPRRGGSTADKTSRNNKGWASQVFPELSTKRRQFGIGVFVAVAERQGDVAEIGHTQIGRFFKLPGEKPKTSLLDQVAPEVVSRLLAGLAHRDRVRIAKAILLGARSHHQIREAVGLKTGPLYHHLRALERAGMVEILDRNTYSLTDFGRLAMLVGAAVSSAAPSKDGKSTLRTTRLKRPA